VLLLLFGLGVEDALGRQTGRDGVIDGVTEKGGKQAKDLRTGQKERLRNRRGVLESLSTGALIFHGCLLPLASVHRTKTHYPWRGHSLRVHWLRRVASELTIYLIGPSTKKGWGSLPWNQRHYEKIRKIIDAKKSVGEKKRT
jgi:hypothetical protein